MKQIQGSVTLSTRLEAALSALPNPSAVLKNKSATMEIFHKVARHPDVYPQISSYKAALCSLQPVIRAENKSIDAFFTDFFRQFDFRSLIRFAASARDYGFSTIEVTQWGTFQGRTVPVKIELCPPEYWVFDKDRKLRLLSKETRDGIDVMTAWPNKFILCQNEDTLTNPYGIGLLDVAFWIAVGLNGNFEFMMQFCEDDGRDKWIGHYQQGAAQEDIDNLLSTLIQLRNNGVAAFPTGMDAEPKTMTGRSSTNDLYQKTDEMLRRKIEKLWTGTDLTMQVQGKGSGSSSESGLTIREDALEEGKTLVLSAIKQVATIICNLNNLPEVPVFQVQQPRSLSKSIAETDQIYFSAGLKPTRELLLKRGYAEDDFILDTTSAKPVTADFAAIPERSESVV